MSGERERQHHGTVAPETQTEFLETNVINACLYRVRRDRQALPHGSYKIVSFGRCKVRKKAPHNGSLIVSELDVWRTRNAALK